MSEKLVIEDFKQFGGKHCQTTAIKSILDYRGLHISEEMLLGLGGGVGFIYWYMKKMPAPFMGTRNGKVDEFILNILRRIGAEATIFETTSTKKAHDELKKMLRDGEPVYIFADMAYLPYMAIPEAGHFGGHTVVVYGIDEAGDKAYISDRGKGAVTVTIEDLKKARDSKFPPFPPKNKMLGIKYPSEVRSLEEGIGEAIGNCCSNMLNPPIKNIGLEGIKKWAGIVPKWPEQFKGINLFLCLFNSFVYIEIGGTGGSAFRPIYAQFLREASTLLDKPALNEVAEMFEDSGKAWSEIAEAALPESFPNLKRIRELSLKKNEIFEKQKPGAQKKMQKINLELDDLIMDAVEDLKKVNPSPLLSDLSQKILKCYKIENKVFQRLNEVVN